MNSMTGFGRGEAEKDGFSFTVELKSVNHRYLESSIRIHHSLSVLEADIRRVLKDRLSRGKVDVFVSYQNHSDAQGQIWLNRANLEGYLKALSEASEQYQLENDLKLSSVLSLPDVLEVDKASWDPEELRPILMDALEQALAGLIRMREEEGLNIRRDFEEKLDELAGCVEQVAERAPEVVRSYQEKLYQRMQEYVDETKVPKLDEGRLETEITIFADRCCIDEEITRLRSHISQYRKIITSKEAVGRKLDFLTQELNREANTIASKSNDLAVTQTALQMKNLIEKIREQVQNIE
ncbi:MAG: YicC family protein [Firmicutes bacterium]|nr:YicC family protein [Bacillota bacterium]